MIELKRLKTYSIRVRGSKVRSADFAQPPCKGRSFRDFFTGLPDILKAKELRQVVKAVVYAQRHKKSVIFMMGAHVIKCGLSPVVIELMRKRVITTVCLNGAGVIHDFEFAFLGKTSEDVGENLKTGKFGMGRETADFINKAVRLGAAEGKGFGWAVAEQMDKANLKHNSLSVLWNAFRLKVPVLVFVAVGTDIIHQHPSFDVASAAEASLRDFYTLVEELSNLNQGGVVINCGSAVILPEVFLKALNLSRNLGNKVKDFTTLALDMLYQYRPSRNVVERPVMSGGKGFYILGHHEILLPLLAQAIIEEL